MERLRLAQPGVAGGRAQIDGRGRDIFLKQLAHVALSAEPASAKIARVLQDRLSVPRFCFHVAETNVVGQRALRGKLNLGGRLPRGRPQGDKLFAYPVSRYFKPGNLQG